MKVKTAHNQIITLGKKLGEGGEGTIYEIVEAPHLCVKIYKQEYRSKKFGKVKTLIEKYKIIKKSRNKEYITIFDNFLAMPRELVFDPNTGEFLGFIMNKLDMSKLKSIGDFFNSDLTKYQTFDKSWEGRCKIAEDLIKTVKCLHSVGIVVGDLNDRNVFVTPYNHVAILDCDSFGVDNYGVDAILGEIAPPEAIDHGLKAINQKYKEEFWRC